MPIASAANASALTLADFKFGTFAGSSVDSVPPKENTARKASRSCKSHIEHPNPVLDKLRFDGVQGSWPDCRVGARQKHRTGDRQLECLFLPLDQPDRLHGLRSVQH